jgi:hypothetical protein
MIAGGSVPDAAEGAARSGLPPADVAPAGRPGGMRANPLDIGEAGEIKC